MLNNFPFIYNIPDRSLAERVIMRGGVERVVLMGVVIMGQDVGG